MKDAYKLAAGEKCLIHAGAGGTGLLLIQIAKLLGAEVFTTVGSEEKAELAKAAGADHTILYRQVDFAEAIEAIAGTRPLDVVYDGVGKTVFKQSLGLLRLRGMMVTFGNASGPVDPISPLELSANGSLYLTRPTLFHYTTTREEIQRQGRRRASVGSTRQVGRASRSQVRPTRRGRRPPSVGRQSRQQAKSCCP